MSEIMYRAAAEQGALVLTQYALMIPLLVAAVLAGWRAVGNVLRSDLSQL